MTEHRPEKQAASGAVNITARDNSVAIGNVGSIDNLNVNVESVHVILSAAAEQTASSAVLSIRSMDSDDPPFVGRQAEVERLRKLLLSGPEGEGTAVVSGTAGIGKTALAKRVAVEVDRLGAFSHAVFIDMRGYEKESAYRARPEGAYASLLRHFGIAGKDLPTAPAEQATLYHQILEGFAVEGKSLLLWLDNVSDVSQYEALQPQRKAHKLLLTTRETFGELPRRVVVDLEVPEYEEAVELLRSSLASRNPGDSRVEAGASSTSDLVSRCDRLPLALQIVAALLADEPHRTIQDLADELAAEENRLDGLHYDARLSVRAALNLSYRRLSDDLKRLFRLLSVVPGGDVGLDAARWLTSSNDVRSKLMALVRAHLIQQHIQNRWSMHDLVRIYSAEESATDIADAERAYRAILSGYTLFVGAVAEWLTAVASATAMRIFPSAQGAATWLECERSSAIAVLLSAVRRPEVHLLAAHFGVVLGDLLKGERHLLSDFHNVAAATASIAMELEDRRIAACTLNNYGSALRMRGEFDKALEVFGQAVKLNEENEDVAGASTSRSNIANVKVDQKKYDEAIALYLADIKVCRESDPPHHYHEAGSLTNLAATYGMVGQLENALPALREALSIRRQLNSPAGVANSLLNLGAVLQQVAEDRNDLTMLQEARQTLLEAGDVYTKVLYSESGQAMVSNNLGVVECQLGEFRSGLANMEAAIRYFEQSGQTERASATQAALAEFQQIALDRGFHRESDET